MKWFDGSVKDAVAEAKQRNSFFVVYVEGTDASSETMTSVLNSKDISEILESENCISILLKPNSKEYQYFVEIYKHVPVPSLFLIGVSGLPIAVINYVAEESPDALRQRVIKMISKISSPTLGSDRIMNKNEEKSSDNTVESKQSAASSRKSLLNSKVSNPVSFTRKNVCSESNSASSKNSGEETVVVTPEMRIPDVSIQSFHVTTTTDADENRQPEAKSEEMKVKRRVSQSKKNNENDLRSQTFQQDKIRNEQDRQRVLNDIAIDKRERMARQGDLNKVHHDVSDVREISDGDTNLQLQNNQTRIQFRMPDGATRTVTFNMTCLLNDLRRFVIENMSVGNRPFSLATAFPRHVFTENEDNQTLEQLQLFPSAVILVLFLQESTSLTSYIYTGVSNTLKLIAYPVLYLARFITNTLYTIGNPAPPITQGVVQPRSSADNTANNTADAASNRRSSSHQSNIHTLSGLSKNKKNDDKNNVWNGNSTQQSQ